MRQTRFSEEDDPLTGGDSLKLYQGMLDQQWAAKLANGRGLGFADMLVKHLERQAGLPDQAADQAIAGKQPDGVPFRSGGLLPTVTGAAHAASVPAVSPAIQPTSQPTVQAAISTGKPAVTGLPAQTAAGERKQQFLDSLRPHAEAAEAATGVPANFILAQAALESGWGGKEIRAADGQASFNLFGIKAGKSWSGDAVETTTTEYRQGFPMKMTQRFRAYADYGAAFTDYANLLKSRFGDAVSTSADTFAQGLANGGYATDPAYAGKLKAVIATVAMAGS
jgi:flagellar protein FlgJ